MKFTLCFITLITFLNTVLCLRKKKCRILALEGGGTKGAFQAGSFKALVDFLHPEEIKYDVITGVSVGSVNGVVLAATEIGKEKEAAQRLSKIWRTIESKNVIANWPYFGIIRGFYDKNSFFDNSPFLTYVTENLKSFGNKLHRRYTIGTVDACKAKTVIVNETIGAQAIPKYVIASAAIPGIFPYSVNGSSIFIDGGTIDNLNIKGGVARCREIVGDDDSSIVIDVIMTNPLNQHTWMNMQNEKSYTIYERGNEIFDEAKSYWYLRDAMTSFPDVIWRYIIAPKTALPNYPVIALSFDRETLKREENIGYEVTKELLKFGKVNFRKVVNGLNSKPTLRRRIK